MVLWLVQEWTMTTWGCFGPSRIYLQSCLWGREREKDREAWHAAVPGATKSRTWLSDWTANAYRLRNIMGKHIYYIQNICAAVQQTREGERERQRARLDDPDQSPGFSCVCSQPPTCISLVLNPELLSLEGYWKTLTIYTLLYIKLITNKEQGTQYSVMLSMRKEPEKSGWMYTCKWFTLPDTWN